MNLGKKTEEYYEQLNTASTELSKFVRMFKSIPAKFQEDFEIEAGTFSGVFGFTDKLSEVSRGLRRYKNEVNKRRMKDHARPEKV